MKVLKWILIVVLALLAVLVIGGYLLSPKFTVSRSITINAPADKVYALVADPRAWRRWSVWTQRDPAMQIDYSGPASGTGARWAWRSKSEGNGSMTFTATEPARRVAFELAFADFGSVSTGELEFVPDGNATRVTWRMDGDTGGNPLFRWIALNADRMVGKDFEAGLARLKAVAEKPAA
ncbi:MAG TPA: SRPBCC family protein [Albitalea sp.]|nr:SRPBCC family protein [Albitalea sp.]